MLNILRSHAAKDGRHLGCEEATLKGQKLQVLLYAATDSHGQGQRERDRNREDGD